MTFVPATAATPHGKLQPLQWNMGSVHKYTEPSFMPQNWTEMRVFRYAPLKHDHIANHLDFEAIPSYLALYPNEVNMLCNQLTNAQAVTPPTQNCIKIVCDKL